MLVPWGPWTVSGSSSAPSFSDLWSAFWLMMPAHHNGACWNLHSNDPSRPSIHLSLSIYLARSPSLSLFHTLTHTHTCTHPCAGIKSQQLLYAAIINHNCLPIFPHLCNVSVRDSKGETREVGKEGEVEKPPQSFLNWWKLPKVGCREVTCDLKVETDRRCKAP